MAIICYKFPVPSILQVFVGLLQFLGISAGSHCSVHSCGLYGTSPHVKEFVPSSTKGCMTAFCVIAAVKKNIDLSIRT